MKQSASYRNYRWMVRRNKPALPDSRFKKLLTILGSKGIRALTLETD